MTGMIYLVSPPVLFDTGGRTTRIVRRAKCVCLASVECGRSRVALVTTRMSIPKIKREIPDGRLRVAMATSRLPGPPLPGPTSIP